jgi:hypothetical protein
MDKDGWKILAIVFIIISAVLFFIVVIEGFILVAIIAYEQDLDNKEVFCDVNICGQFENYSSYIFDEYEEICYCHDKEGELLHKEVVMLDY